MKNIKWKWVMFFTVLMMLVGLFISIKGIENHDDAQAYVGLITIGIVCASWWFWVMFVIRTITQQTHRTIENIAGIREDIKEVKSLLLDK